MNASATLSAEWFEAIAERLAAASVHMANAAPFAHVVIDDFLPEDYALACASAFPRPDAGEWIHYSHYNSAKWGLTDIDKIPGPLDELIHGLNSARFLSSLSALSGIDDLLADPDLSGGGLHMTGRGGFLNVHTDFSSHPTQRSWRRRLNLLLYLNHDWDDEWGGHLELWDEDVSECTARIAPSFNRCVIFATDDRSYHGVPERLTAPTDRFRCSVALYYFTEQAEPVESRATNYRPRPSDGKKAWIIRADNWILSRYSRVRTRLGIDDRAMGRVLGRLRSIGRPKR